MTGTPFAKWFAPDGFRPRERRPAGRPPQRSRRRVPPLEARKDRVVANFSPGTAANQAILFEGGGVNNTLGIPNNTTKTRRALAGEVPGVSA
jgi:hypothetical protein